MKKVAREGRCGLEMWIIRKNLCSALVLSRSSALSGCHPLSLVRDIMIVLLLYIFLISIQKWNHRRNLTCRKHSNAYQTVILVDSLHYSLNYGPGNHINVRTLLLVFDMPTNPGKGCDRRINSNTKRGQLVCVLSLLQNVGRE